MLTSFMFEDKQKERGIASKPLMNMSSTQTNLKQCNETSSWFCLSPNLTSKSTHILHELCFYNACLQIF